MGSGLQNARFACQGPLTLKRCPLSACSYFVPENSRPDRNRYFFAYKVGACKSCLYFMFFLDDLVLPLPRGTDQQ